MNAWGDMALGAAGAVGVNFIGAVVIWIRIRILTKRYQRVDTMQNIEPGIHESIEPDTLMRHPAGLRAWVAGKTVRFEYPFETEYAASLWLHDMRELLEAGNEMTIRISGEPFKND